MRAHYFALPVWAAAVALVATGVIISNIAMLVVGLVLVGVSWWLVWH